MLPVSVVMTAFNHENYIQYSIESVLNQNFNDFELIIVDDGSSDRTREIINSFYDNRIRRIYKNNEGTSKASNTGIGVAKGKYIALMSGDDVCDTRRLEIQYKIATEYGYQCIMTMPELIDDSNNRLVDSIYPVFYSDFIWNKESTFSKLFFYGNFFCAPSAFINKGVLDRLGDFCLSYLQLQDYEMWIRISREMDIFVDKERLLKYRLHSNNLSRSLSNGNRSDREFLNIYADFLCGMDWSLLNNKFPGHFSTHSYENPVCLEIEKTFLYLKCMNRYGKEIGINRMLNHFKNDEHIQILEHYYNFKVTDLYKLTNCQI